MSFVDTYLAQTAALVEKLPAATMTRPF